MKDFMQIKTLRLWNGYHRKLATCKNFFFSINKIALPENFNYSSQLANSAYKRNRPILEINKNERNKKNMNKSKNGNDNYEHAIPDGNDEFYELIKKTFKEKKNDLGLWNIYCREIMYRINEKNLSPKIITNSLTLLSYTEYENNRIFIEIINRCILRLKDFDLIHICSMINFLCKKNLKSVYLLQEIRKRIIDEKKIEFFDKPSSPHYISLLINSLIKLDYFNNINNNFENKQFLFFLLQKIENNKPSEFSLVGLSLLLYNISKLKITEKYHLFILYHDHILKLKKHFNVIQVINILSAYNTTNLLTFPILTQLLESLIYKNHLFKKISLRHLVRLVQISFRFLSKNGKNLRMIETGSNISDKQNNYKMIIQMNVHIFNSIFNTLPFCKKKEYLVLLCSTLSTYKELVMKCFDIKKDDKESVFIIENINELFKLMKTNLINLINTCNSIELSIIFYCYSIYKINDINLFQCIKLRVLRIFSTFDEKTFSYIFKAFKNLKIEDNVFEYSCLNKIIQFNHFNSINNLSRILSAYIMITPKKQIPKITNIFFESFKQILIRYFEKKKILLTNSFNCEPIKQIEYEKEYDDEHFIDIVSIVIKLFSKVLYLNIPSFIIFISNYFYKYTKNILINNIVTILDSLAIMSSKIKTKENKLYWKNYYCMVNYYVNKILETDQIYKNKTLMINFISSTGKIYHSFIRDNLDNYFILNENNIETNLCFKNISHKSVLIGKEDNSQFVFKNFFFFKSILDMFLSHLKNQIKNMTIGEITVLMECLKKENYSEEAICLILKNEDKIFFNDLVERCITIFTDFENPEKKEAKYYMNYDNKKNGIIILKNLILLQIYNNKLVDLIVKNYILQYNYLSSINLLSQSIYYLCIYSLWTECFVKKKQIYLLKFLIQKIYELFINNHILIHNFSNSDINISLNQIKKLSEDISFINSIKYLYEAILIILLNMTNLFPINPIITTSQKKNIIYNTSFFINDINFLRLYLSVFNIVDHIMEKNKYHQVIINHKSELSPITIQIQNIFQNLDIKIAKSTLFHFYNIIKLSF
ncbi:conserved Plasmodium protein, unknown function [Plasmodium berghei]|uniref:Uncharacterized protein n=2 Tax=Plasmodium berghei TaxID=5821 RepID=A0A509ASM9_PLABA|nr:conserved Plasmodium protein, unknown function [Plasmodium berghei ANKA]CXJ00092.1 conserved Plasmodium protein, unknown function [Plasmodium berghei]SCL97957.1 conserved Plasmodium protein, unknown function [Plasmodium berghei]SCM16721.1 conserved Plasmodium protein, unknown function [Plasmodium berghei]SCM18519.1 conserved Plasmodium protein, unknown function [Plasmodium berghei]SCN27952.1 conserved Plasmodium protein, unknown function [Plasmodium berghei]|eukprot:XP_034423605.1 conserved Plasmodium protein, unknown function [Plasmodium berghei ANKA]